MPLPHLPEPLLHVLTPTCQGAHLLRLGAASPPRCRGLGRIHRRPSAAEGAWVRLKRSESLRPPEEPPQGEGRRLGPHDKAVPRPRPRP